MTTVQEKAIINFLKSDEFSAILRDAIRKEVSHLEEIIIELKGKIGNPKSEQAVKLPSQSGNFVSEENADEKWNLCSEDIYVDVSMLHISRVKGQNVRSLNFYFIYVLLKGNFSINN